MKKLIALTFALPFLLFADPVEEIQKAGFAGGLVVQIGSDDLSLKDLGERFHVRLLLPDAKAVEKAQQAIDRAGLQGRFTVSEYTGGDLPFAERVVNGLIVSSVECRVEKTEIERVLMPRGLFFNHQSSISNPQFITPVPDTIDDWTHYLYDASGNAVSKDKEVASPRSFRWWAPPMHLRSHNYSSSFTGLISEKGKVFYILDEGTFLFDKGGATEKFALIARDAFNGALLWKKELEGYGQPFYEDVSGQAVNDFIWRTPLSMNRRLVAIGDRVYAALKYRGSPLSILDAATGNILHEVPLGGVDELIADEQMVICRVRPEIPKPTEDMKGANAWGVTKRMEKEGIKNPKEELRARVMDGLMAKPNEKLAAVDAKSGKMLWQIDAPLVGVQSFVMADGKVVYHNYEALIALDANTGEKVWSYANPARRSVLPRNLLGNLLIVDGKVLWTSSATGGGVCLNLEDGTEVWKNNMGTTGGFGFPTAQRVINGIIYGDGKGWPNRLSDGQRTEPPDVGDMYTRGHHIRCFPGKATERFLITPQRGAEFIDLSGAGEHMVNDWLRGACSLGQMPANGLFYVTPDPCSCYAGARIYGFHALAPKEPAGLPAAPPPESAERLIKGGAFTQVSGFRFQVSEKDWSQYRGNAKRTALAPSPLAAELKTAWSAKIGGELTQATIAGGMAFLVRKDTYELICLNLADGKTAWTQSFPAALDGPPTLVGGKSDTRHPTPDTFLFLGSADGKVTCLRSSDGAVVWQRLLAPLERMALDADQLSSLWPVHTSVLFHNGLIYTLAGRSSYLDGGIHLYALDPATGAVKHHTLIRGPWPDEETLRTGVVTERDRKAAEKKGNEELLAVDKVISDQYATGYHLYGAESDLLVTDGADLYLTQNRFDAELNQVPLKRSWNTGYTPMGGYHMSVDSGFLDDTMFHRTHMMYDDAWSSYGSAPGSAARAGTLVSVGKNRAYAAQHFKGGGYAGHDPGDGNRIVADALDVENLPPGMMEKEQIRELKLPTIDKSFNRTAAPLWTTETPIIIRAFLAAPHPEHDELLFSGGIVEGKTLAEWDQSTYFIGPGKLQVHAGKDGKKLAEYDLPACPVFDGLSAADGKLIVPMVNGEIMCFSTP